MDSCVPEFGQGGFAVKKSRRAVFLLVLFLAVQFCVTAALATDDDLVWQLPGTWLYTAAFDEENADLASLTLEKDGKMVLHSSDAGGGYVYSGSWTLKLTGEPSPLYGYNDCLSFLFTYTDDPRFSDTGYNVECDCYVYAESWVEDSTRYTYLICEDAVSSGITPFEMLCSERGAAVLHKDEGPNMRIVNCKSYVSLREERSTESARLAKVPLGETVFAFPEDTEKNGFVRCVFGEEYGYILTEYLCPVSADSTL